MCGPIPRPSTLVASPRRTNGDEVLSPTSRSAEGPRKCIGANMAMIQMLLILSAFIRRYDFELVDDRPIDIDPMMILLPKGPIAMRVSRRD